MKSEHIAVAAGWILLAIPVSADGGAAERIHAEIAAAAAGFFTALTEDLRSKVGYPVDDDERFNWHYVPRTGARRGVPLKDLTPEQTARLRDLLRSTLSGQGMDKIDGILVIEEILGVLERNPVRRDPDLYYITLFGKPGVAYPWGWRFEGHHLSLNFTFARDAGFAVTPAFYGANPATVPAGQRHPGLRVLASEEDLGRKLLDSLDEGQLRTAIISPAAPRDIITGANREILLREPTGISYEDLNHEQRRHLIDLIKVYTHNLRPEIAEDRWERIRERGVENLHFAWAGGREPGEGHYYRIQGPTLLIEYDNVQNQANHVHSVWRDPENDFGVDLLRRHYEAAH